MKWFKSRGLKRILLATGLLMIGWILGSVFSGRERQADRAMGGSGDGATDRPPTEVATDRIPITLDSKKMYRPRELAMTEAARKLAQIQTVVVTKRLIEAEIPLVGKIEFDETRTRTMAARFPARIDRLYVDYTGIEVRKGDHLANIYSPELLQAQQELLSAIKFRSNIDNARDKLRLWDLSEQRIDAIVKRGKPSDRIDIEALLGGIVIAKHVNEGDYVKTGQPLFTIADLSTVWVQLDAYESDLAWIRYGQPVRFEVEAVPGKTLEGKVAFISPTLDPKSRTVDVRVNANNPQQVLKPEMFVHARVRTTLAAGGKVVAPDLEGKWISPMHPEIIRDEPGTCPVCGMPLVSVDEVGYDVIEPDEELPIVVPTTAVLRTGRRSLVYVEVPGEAQPTYEGREVLIGPRAGDYYIIEEGLMEGERVVTHGNFKIDSSLQILAKPSMMNPEGGGGGGGHRHGDSDPASGAEAGHEMAMRTYKVDAAFHAQLAGVFEAYLKIHEALAGDDLEGAKSAAPSLTKALSAVDMSLLGRDAHMEWMNQLAPIRGSGELIGAAPEPLAARTAFASLSKTLIYVAQVFGTPLAKPLVHVHCPMAFDNRGAEWLQLGEEIRNPYFGAEMLNCGEVKMKLSASPAEEPQSHEGKTHGNS